MTKHKLTAFGALIVSAILLVGCFKTGNQKEDLLKAGVKDFLEIEEGIYHGFDFPEPDNNKQISNVSMNGNLVAGGTAFVTLTVPSDMARVIVGIKDQFGYCEAAPVRNNDGTCSVVLVVKQDISLEEFTLQFAYIDMSGEVSQIYTVDVSLIQVGTGKLQVSVSFDNAKDIDLHLIEPNGAHIYYGHSSSSNGGQLDLDSNAGCSIDNINNENIYYEDDATVEAGTYKAYVVMYENCDESVATNYVLTVRYNGRVLNTVTGTFPVGAPSTGSSLSNLEPTCTFVIGGKGMQGTGKTYLPKVLSPEKL